MFEEQQPINPLHFFQFSADCHYLKECGKKFPALDAQKPGRFELPATAAVSKGKASAKVALGWHADGIEAAVFVPLKYPLTVRYPEITLGDSVEFFFDTRDIKTSGYNTRYCHHFFFLPEAVDGIQAAEKTKFRTDDAHPLCDPSELQLKAQTVPGGYTLNIFIPKQCLFGYDPDEFQRLGFNYRVNKFDQPPEEFSTLTRDFQVEQQPSLWSTLKLTS